MHLFMIVLLILLVLVFIANIAVLYSVRNGNLSNVDWNIALNIVFLVIVIIALVFCVLKSGAMSSMERHYDGY